MGFELMIKKIVVESKNPTNKAIFLLTGRGQTAKEFLNLYWHVQENFHLIALEPAEEWYPIPNGPDDQFDSIQGVEKTVSVLHRKIKKIRKKIKIKKKNTILIGFSAGGVVMLKLLSKTKNNYHSAICHNGTILDTNIEYAKNKTPILLIHSKDDDCFSWEERYLPTKFCLQQKKYLVETIEKEIGGHDIKETDIDEALKFIQNNNKYNVCSSNYG